jgi:CRISPR system Cascade subunit CasE
MYLSKIALDKKYAARPYQWHRALWSLFPERPAAQRDFLFRLESCSPTGRALFLMQSAQLPSSSADAEVIAAKAFSPRLSEGMQLRFKLRANPVKTIRDAGGRLNGKGEVKHCRVPLIDPDQQIAWLQRKLAAVAEIADVIAVTEPPLG